MTDINSIVSKIRKILRKDAGVGGDEQRLTQIVWMMFLKILDDKEKELELVDQSYVSSIPKEYRWRNWAADPEGMTGKELFDFVDKQLFPALANIPLSENKYGNAIHSIFSDTHNYLKSGTHIRQVCNELNKVNFNKKADRDVLGDIYERLLNEMAAALNKGEYYTPRPLTRFIVEGLEPKLGEKVLDPSCGTGGFLLGVVDYVDNHEVHSQEQKRELMNSIKGVELKALPHLLATTNMILHDVEDPSVIKRDDMLARNLTDYGPQDKVDVIIANPPFSGEIVDGTEQNFPSKFRTKSTALLFLVLFVHLLKDGGRAGVVLPDGVLFGDGVDTEIKKELLSKCNLHTIVRLPSKTFLYAGANTNVLFFEKGKPTKETWFYHMKPPEGFKNYTKGRPINDGDFADLRSWWHDRVENDLAHKVSIEQIEERNFNLDIKNPNGGDLVEQLSSEELKEKIMETEKSIQVLLKMI